MKKKRIWAIFLFALIIIIPSIILKNIIEYSYPASPAYECPEGWICDPGLTDSLYDIISVLKLLGVQVFLSFLAGFFLLGFIKEAKLKDVISTVMTGIVFTFITDLTDVFPYLIITLIICIPFSFMGGYLGRKMKGNKRTIK